MKALRAATLVAMALAFCAQSQGCVSPAPNQTARTADSPARSETKVTPCNPLASQGNLRDWATSSHQSSDTRGYAKIEFNHEMSSKFHLKHELFLLDGAVQRDETIRVGLVGPPEPTVFAGVLPSGEHKVELTLLLDGTGMFRGYHFEMKSSHKFDIDPGRAMEVRVVTYEREGRSFPERPAVCFEERPSDVPGSIANTSRQSSDPAAADAGASAEGNGP